MVKSLSKNKLETNLETITIESEVKTAVRGVIAPRFVRLSDPWHYTKSVPTKAEKR